MKDQLEHVKSTYNHHNAVRKYVLDIDDIGLWESERILFKKYVTEDSSIIDIGCGAGRTTFGLYKIGYTNITGVDLSENLIENAIEIAKEREISIKFETGNALELKYKDSSFDSALFSFNGIMHIPLMSNRVKTMTEIKRIIKTGSKFIFTTHEDRDRVEEFKDFWKNYKKTWEEGKQDKRLLEYGDSIFTKDNLEYYIHFATKDEIIHTITEAGLSLTETMLRSEICDENKRIKEYSVDCRFWITEKK
ncbi:class I SAM-dependent methyltransferase [Alkaliphilus peptidifermentans]|uniref:Ubiquinone/menaquinone biosynthesis C-methylase UbiE n=1 Tax=Alkaliphilus peptidifermentans DSM 18978 TaxID=1120976 RepID=A0A1G5GXA0_9FIRM|nr:class I SAM-dependent methyltransferase [Alkaliphilus peptidifermentans]SCY55278.1 Ubiquinone/menaquinone biosynthesis C-methylase UbiE [Alkaliphilus peptidifermentans DSM 18978]